MSSRYRIEDFVGGWFIGNFSPAILHSDHVEVCVKYFKAGDVEPDHYQLTATEVSVVISGECMIAGQRLGPGDVIELSPLEVAGFEAISDVAVVAVKSPSISSDKVMA